MGWLGPDESVWVGRFSVRRPVPGDAAAYALADAEMVSGTYQYTMPPEFAVQQLADVPAATEAYRVAFELDLAAERRGEEPDRRTWLALSDRRIVGIAVSASVAPPWEEELGAVPIDGVTQQLNHLYLRPDVHGQGLAQALLDIALPDEMPAYLWLVGGNARAERFYLRNGFQFDPLEYSCGPQWFHRPLHRMYRR